MRNPFRSEAEAFRFLLLTIGYFALIVIGAVINTWLGVAVFVVAHARRRLLRLHARARRAAAARRADAHAPDDERRILVIANETVAGETLHAMIRRRARATARTCSSSRRRSPRRCSTVASDDDPGAARGAERGSTRASPSSARAGVSAHGAGRRRRSAAGDRGRAPDVRRPTRSSSRRIRKGTSHWLERGVVEHARERFAVPITHVVVDVERRIAAEVALAARAAEQVAELVRERREPLRLERVDDVVALALRRQQTPARREQSELLRRAGVRQADERRELLRAPRPLADELEDPERVGSASAFRSATSCGGVAGAARRRDAAPGTTTASGHGASQLTRTCGQT